MFKNLFDFSYKRSALEAFGFYLAYFFLIILGAMLAGGLIGAIFPSSASVYGYRLGLTVAVGACVYLSSIVLVKKNLLKNYGYLLLVILSGILALFGGGLLGLIPAAFLSTRKKAVAKK